jgi:hypothetical protein
MNMYLWLPWGYKPALDGVQVLFDIICGGEIAPAGR